MVPAAQTVSVALPCRSAARMVCGMVLFAGLTAAGTALRIPLPGTSVPLTLQSLPVLICGAVLGPWQGCGSQALYVLAGLAGLPVFSGDAAGLEYVSTQGSTAGYLLGFVVAPWIVGRISALRRPQGAPLVLATAAGSGVIFLLGCSWLALSTGSVAVAVTKGLLPFVPWAVIVWGLASAISARLRRRAAGAVRN